MKQGLPILLSGLAWLQVAAAACCRSNKCLKAVVSSGLDGIQDCSANLAVTITPIQSTVTETVTQLPTELNTLVHTAFFTETVTTTAETKTELFTVQTTVIDSTYTEVVTNTETVVVTQTAQHVVTSSPSSVINPVKARGDTLLAPEPEPTFPASGPEPSTIPEYASEKCPSWEAYVNACKCAGVEPTAVTAEAPSATTVTVSYTADPITVSVPTTLSVTDTIYVSLTEKTAATDIETVFVTATTQLTQTVAVQSTVTVTQTSTVVLAGPTCLPPSDVRAFRAMATLNNAPVAMYANMLNALSGGMNWQTPSTSTSTSVQYKYFFKLDSEGRVILAKGIPPYSYEYALYASTGTTGSVWPQVNTKQAIENSIRAGGAVSFIKGCVNSETGELTLDAAGRKSILWCGNQLWMSYGNGEDINRGTCVRMYPEAREIEASWG
ncbi:hypothetical protein QBC36DRAFT_94239 [Triangularia setosa]|uniref:Uncharacterized protein n=1 Tax=Triangularia setosa TaxID=2587417 RepID=A0AAN6WB85_9PEZI|nr:hypothetical protein QBC36DRAFT_94239 [Podospora setosa]